MWRFLAGVGSTLLLVSAGLIFWQSRAGDTLPKPAVAAPRDLNLPLLGDPPVAPSAEAKTREEKRFNRLDKDKNEAIDAPEYFASRQKAFAKLDANRDGRLSFDEWAVKAREKFAKADGDRSGRLTRAEFATTAVVRKTKPKPDCPPPRTAPDPDDA